jgi:hypothetical protein
MEHHILVHSTGPIESQFLGEESNEYAQFSARDEDTLASCLAESDWTLVFIRMDERQI